MFVRVYYLTDILFYPFGLPLPEREKGGMIHKDVDREVMFPTREYF